jgi:hypothetical protein
LDAAAAQGCSKTEPQQMLYLVELRQSLLCSAAYGLDRGVQLTVFSK